MRAAALVSRMLGAARVGAAIAPRAAAVPSLARPMSTSADPLDTLIRFRAHDGEEYYGLLSPDETKARIAERGPAGMRISSTEKEVDIILPPVDPPQIFCIGLNYIDHAAEVKMETPKYPVVFTKTLNTLTGHNSAIVIPKVASDPPEVDYEAELAVVIGREAKNVKEEEAMDYVLGYTIANDVTARRWQGKRGGGQWTRGKCFDTFLPLGPYLVPKSRIPDPQNLRIRTWLNDSLVQDGNTSMMVFPIAKLIAFLSEGTTLLPGSVILTGTPAGVGYVKNVYLKRGDIVRVSIDGLGTLRNPVATDVGWGAIEF